MSVYVRLMLATLICLSWPIAVHAYEQENRVALLISANAYEKLPTLRNPNSDSDLIASALSSIGFNVTQLKDASRTQINVALTRFSFISETSDVALVYFAGHGFAFGGKNFLAPIEASARSRNTASTESIRVDDVVKSVANARQLRIVALDSCRNDPFGGLGAAVGIGANSEALTTETQEQPVPRTRGLGLARPSPVRGTLISYAAEAGNVALDGDGKHSPYAAALAKYLVEPDLEIGLAFRRVRDHVIAETDKAQVPHTYGSLSGEPYFLAGKSTTANLLEDLARKAAWSKLSESQFEQLQSLANEGDLRSLKALAYMRLGPESPKFDPSAAVSLLARAAEQNDPEAQFELGKLHELGMGVDQDVSQAIKLYKAAAGQDYGDALNDLGFIYFQGSLDVPRSPDLGIEYFQKAADMGHPEAMFNIAAMIDDGKVRGANLRDASRYLYRAVRSGNSAVLNELLTSPNSFKPDVLRGLQALLSEHGFYDGKIDAIFGNQTKKSLRRAFGEVQ